jgi:hypothetical protein
MNRTNANQKLKYLPIGRSSLTGIIENNYLYVDKTKFVQQLIAKGGKYYFLSRPRRFGKSLFIDTLKQAFLGNKKLFTGLYLENNWDWSKSYPVIHIDFSISTAYNSETALLDNIQAQISYYAKLYDVIIPEVSHNVQFDILIKQINQKVNNTVVILIDEYDKPILDVLHDISLAQINREILKGLYGVIKANDAILNFVFLAGVSKFSKVNLFSGLNNLNDISLDTNYADICGYTQIELWDNFAVYLSGVDPDKLKSWYNGYNFAGITQQNVYNPFDILLFIDKGHKYYPYWFETGTPTFLVKLLQQRKFYFPELESIHVRSDDMQNFDIDNLRLPTLLQQTGYLTIKSQKERGGVLIYELTYPNFEVKTSFTNQLANISITDNAKEAIYNALDMALKYNNFTQFGKAITSIFASIPHQWYRNNNIQDYEGFYCSIVYCYLVALGYQTVAEDVTNHGQIDLTIILDDKIIIIEFKLKTNGDAKSALQQIKSRKYFEKYQTQNKTIHLLGISFDTDLRNVDDFCWEIITYK